MERQLLVSFLTLLFCQAHAPTQQPLTAPSLLSPHLEPKRSPFGPLLTEKQTVCSVNRESAAPTGLTAGSAISFSDHNLLLACWILNLLLCLQSSLQPVQILDPILLYLHSIPPWQIPSIACDLTKGKKAKQNIHKYIHANIQTYIERLCCYLLCPKHSIRKSLQFILTVDLSLYPSPINEYIFVKRYVKERT